MPYYCFSGLMGLYKLSYRREWSDVCTEWVGWVNYFEWPIRQSSVRRKVILGCPDLSRFRRIHAGLIQFFFGIFSVVPTVFHMVFNPIHQLALRLSIKGGDVGDVAALQCFDVDEKYTLTGFMGFAVSWRDIGVILLPSIVHPSALETVMPSALPPKTRWVI